MSSPRQLSILADTLNDVDQDDPCDNEGEDFREEISFLAELFSEAYDELP